MSQRIKDRCHRRLNVETEGENTNTLFPRSDPPSQQNVSVCSGRVIQSTAGRGLLGRLPLQGDREDGEGSVTGRGSL